MSTQKIAPKGPKRVKGPNCGRIKTQKIGLYFHTNNRTIQVSFLGFVITPVMCIQLFVFSFSVYSVSQSL